ncbi:hypothetical protein STENM327S_07121 [Streptomyces tendae]
MRSLRRPGVATTTLMPPRRALACRPIGIPPTTGGQAQPHRPGVRRERVGDLLRQLARRYEIARAAAGPQHAPRPYGPAGPARRPGSCRNRCGPGPARRGRRGSSAASRAGSGTERLRPARRVRPTTARACRDRRNSPRRAAPGRSSSGGANSPCAAAGRRPRPLPLERNAPPERAEDPYRLPFFAGAALPPRVRGTGHGSWPKSCGTFLNAAHIKELCSSERMETQKNRPSETETRFLDGRIPRGGVAAETAAEKHCSWGPHPEGCGPRLRSARRRARRQVRRGRCSRRSGLLALGDVEVHLLAFEELAGARGAALLRPAGDESRAATVVRRGCRGNPDPR